ncbi:MAG: SH3 domain-containing protein [Saprospiraceae bacterium]
MTILKNYCCGVLALLLTLIHCDVAAGITNNAQDQFKLGNQYYQKAQYIDAIQQYQSLISSGFASDELFSNLGNAYLKEQKIGKSILNFEKALILNPRNNQATINIALAKESITNTITFIPDFFLASVLHNAVNQLSIMTWVILHLLLLITCLVFAFIYWSNSHLEVKEKLRSHYISSAIFGIFLLLSGLSLLAAIERYDHIYGVNYGIVMQDNISLLDGPDKRSNEVALLSQGVRAKVLDQINDWYKVQLDDKDEGWVPVKSIDLIQLKA